MSRERQQNEMYATKCCAHNFTRVFFHLTVLYCVAVLWCCCILPRLNMSQWFSLAQNLHWELTRRCPTTQLITNFMIDVVVNWCVLIIGYVVKTWTTYWTFRILFGLKSCSRNCTQIKTGKNCFSIWDHGARRVNEADIYIGWNSCYRQILSMTFLQPDSFFYTQ